MIVVNGSKSNVVIVAISGVQNIIVRYQASGAKVNLGANIDVRAVTKCVPGVTVIASHICVLAPKVS